MHNNTIYDNALAMNMENYKYYLKGKKILSLHVRTIHTLWSTLHWAYFLLVPTWILGFKGHHSSSMKHVSTTNCQTFAAKGLFPNFNHPNYHNEGYVKPPCFNLRLTLSYPSDNLSDLHLISLHFLPILHILVVCFLHFLTILFSFSL